MIHSDLNHGILFYMKFKTLQWNINGGKIRTADSDPTKGPGSLKPSYIHEGFDYIVSKIKEYDVDIITLQETHADTHTIQAQVIAEKLGFPYWTNDRYEESHLEKGQGLCQSIISKYPISYHTFELFNNPYFEAVAEDGSTWISHDKGYSLAEMTLSEDKMLTVITLHLLPFPRFKLALDDRSVIEVLTEVSNKLVPHTSNLTLIQGDFNIDDISLKSHLPELFTSLQEIEAAQPTTPGDSRFDHVLYKNVQLISTKVYDTVLTDHYPIISEFEV